MSELSSLISCAISAGFATSFILYSLISALAKPTSDKYQDVENPSAFHPWTKYDELTAPYRDKRARTSKGGLLPAEHKNPVAATLNLLADCLEVYLTEIDGPTHPPQFVRASLVVLDHCALTPSDAAIVGRLTTTILDASDAHERAFRRVLHRCDEVCAFLEAFLAMHESQKAGDGQVLVSAFFTEGRTILTDTVASIATTGSLVQAAHQDLKRLLPASIASLGAQRLESLEPTDVEEIEAVSDEDGPMPPQYHLCCLDTRMKDVITLLKDGMSTLASKKVTQELDMQEHNPASWEQMDERFLASLEASMHRFLANYKKCRGVSPTDYLDEQ